MGKLLYIWSKKVHRWTLLAVTFLILVMGYTGLLMKYSAWPVAVAAGGSARYIHNQLSVWFTVFLGLMMVTGLYMYCYPPLAAARRRKVIKNTTTASPTTTENNSSADSL